MSEQTKKQTSIKRAAYINVAAKYSSALLQLAYSVILARILTPDDFGIVAIAQVFVVFFNIFSDMGLGAAIIQRQDLSKQDVSRLFGFTILLAATLALLFALFGIPISAIYERAELTNVCVLLSLSVFFATLNTVPNSLLMKQKRFLLVGIRQIVAVLAASLIGVTLACIGIGYYAIVVYSIANSFIVFVWNYVPIRVLPVFRGILLSVRKVFSYSAYLFGFNAITYFSRNLDNLLVGFFFGTATLGNYNKAYQLMRLPQIYLTGAVTPVLHPILAERQKDADYLYKTFLKTVKVLSLLGVYITVFCCMCAEEIVIVMYGEQWETAIPCLQFLAISIWSQMVCATSGTMFQVLNRTREQFIRGVIIAGVIVSGIILGVLLGSVEAVAACVGVAYYVSFALLLPFLVKLSFGKSVRAFLKILLPDLGIAAFLVLFLMLLGFVPIENLYLSFAAKLIASLIFYLVILVLSRQLKWLSLVFPQQIKRKLPKWLTR